jgi:hypothetical protein
MIKSHALIDYGATGYAFIAEGFAHRHHLPLHLLKSPKNLTIIDGRPVTLEAITTLQVHILQSKIISMIFPFLGPS